jgi:nitrogen fixation-related uncharacterized protein
MIIGGWLVVFWMIFVAIIGLVMLWYGWATGQFKTIEEPKYRMLQEREPEAWPEKTGQAPKGPQEAPE